MDWCFFFLFVFFSFLFLVSSPLLFPLFSVRKWNEREKKIEKKKEKNLKGAPLYQRCFSFHGAHNGGPGKGVGFWGQWHLWKFRGLNLHFESFGGQIHRLDSSKFSIFIFTFFSTKHVRVYKTTMCYYASKMYLWFLENKF